MRSHNKRCDDLRVALSRGHCSNGNHMIKIGEGVIQKNDWCQGCPESLRCFLVGKTIDVQEALQKAYPCIDDKRYILFHYHGACCITFDCKTKQINDHGYWGYSVTTSRSIRWYLEALFYHGFIDAQQTVEDAIAYFKKRKPDVHGRWEWFQC